jgi:hypothetical protein
MKGGKREEGTKVGGGKGEKTKDDDKSYVNPSSLLLPSSFFLPLPQTFKPLYMHLNF